MRQLRSAAGEPVLAGQIGVGDGPQLPLAPPQPKAPEPPPRPRPQFTPALLAAMSQDKTRSVSPLRCITVLRGVAHATDGHRMHTEPVGLGIQNGSYSPAGDLIVAEVYPGTRLPWDDDSRKSEGMLSANLLDEVEEMLAALPANSDVVVVVNPPEGDVGADYFDVVLAVPKSRQKKAKRRALYLHCSRKLAPGTAVQISGRYLTQARHHMPTSSKSPIDIRYGSPFDPVEVFVKDIAPEYDRRALIMAMKR